ncbi:MAG TPA: vWA domain-containing protein, partial [Tepidisphaeraceae bacterium]|nr:vWA domain-containing protein [Tepidisphaeraceae bacterium]
TKLIVRSLPSLPPNDPVRVGQFSDTLRWWSDGHTAKQTAALPLPPPDAVPHGPTNLEPALEAIARDAPKSMPTQLLLLTDAGAEIDDPDALTQKLRAANVRLNLMAIDHGEGLPVLEDMVRDTGGVYMTDLNPATWSLAMRELLAAAMPDRLHRDGITLRFHGSLNLIWADPWNRTWLKPNATALASAGQIVMAAQWQFGLGQVIAVAFEPGTDVANSLADSIAQPPIDPRISVRWQTGPILHATVDAINGLRYLNNLNLSLEVQNQRYPIPQTEPGRYEISLPSPATPSVATVWLGNRLIDRTALAGWYDRQFAAVGEDRAALEKLARETGGHVIPPDQKTPIQFGRTSVMHDMTSWSAAAAALFMGIGLIAWKLTPAAGRLSVARPVHSRAAETSPPRHWK